MFFFFMCLNNFFYFASSVTNGFPHHKFSRLWHPKPQSLNCFLQRVGKETSCTGTAWASSLNTSVSASVFILKSNCPLNVSKGPKILCLVGKNILTDSRLILTSKNKRNCPKLDIVFWCVVIKRWTELNWELKGT